MKPVNQELAEKILETGKAEFMKKGFKGSSMREIASKAGVTTGAVYRYYENKEAIFEALVQEKADHLLSFYEQLSMKFEGMSAKEQLIELPEQSTNGFHTMLHYLYEHFDIFKLIFCCAEGTVYSDYIERFIDIEVHSSMNLIEGMKKSQLLCEIDEMTVHIMASTFFNGLAEVIRHDIPLEQAMKQLYVLQKFYAAGWYHLLGISNWD